MQLLVTRSHCNSGIDTLFIYAWKLLFLGSIVATSAIVIFAIQID